MKVTYYGHSCFSIQIEGTTFLLDPFISPNPLAYDIDIAKIKADYVLLSHGHEDHVADAETIIKNTGATLISNFEIVNWFADTGIENGVGMNIGGAYQTPICAIKMVAAMHSSSMPDGSYGGLAAGFVLVYQEDEVDKVAYFAGDTGLHRDMELIQEEFGFVDFAFLPIGDLFTMGVNDAVEAGYLLNADCVIPMHYNTFPPIEVNIEEAKKEFEEFRFEIFNIGEEKELI